MAFIVIPRTCLEHSFYLDLESWLLALKAVGLGVDASHETEKLMFFECVASEPDSMSLKQFNQRGKPAAAGKGRQSRGAEFNVSFE